MCAVCTCVSSGAIRVQDALELELQVDVSPLTEMLRTKFRLFARAVHASNC